MAKSIGELLKDIREKESRLYRPNPKDDPLYVENGEILTCGDKWVIDCLDYNGEFAAQEGKTLVSVIQSANEIVYVITEGKQYSSEFTGTIGEEFTTVVVPNDGYVGGTANPESGVIEEGLIVTVSPAAIRYCTVSVTQSEHQTIEVTVDGNPVTEGNPVTVPYGANYTITITPEDGYKAGAINYPETGSVTGDMNITAEPASLETYTISIYSSDENQTISVWIPNKSTGTEYTSSIEGVQRNTQYEIVINAAEGYIPGELSCDRVGYVLSDMNVNASEAYKPDSPPQRKSINAYVISKSSKDSEYDYIGSMNNISSGNITEDTIENDTESNLQSVKIRYIKADITTSNIDLTIQFGYVDARYNQFNISIDDGEKIENKDFEITTDEYNDSKSEVISIPSSNSAYSKLKNLFETNSETAVTLPIDIEFSAAKEEDNTEESG